MADHAAPKVVALIAGGRQFPVLVAQGVKDQGQGAHAEAHQGGDDGVAHEAPQPGVDPGLHGHERPGQQRCEHDERSHDFFLLRSA